MLLNVLAPLSHELLVDFGCKQIQIYHIILCHDGLVQQEPYS